MDWYLAVLSIRRPQSSQCPALWKVNDQRHPESSGAQCLTMQSTWSPAPVHCLSLSITSFVLLGKLLNLLISSTVKRTTLVKNMNGLNWESGGSLWKLTVCSFHSPIGTVLKRKIEDLKEGTRKCSRLVNYIMKRVTGMVTAYGIEN